MKNANFYEGKGQRDENKPPINIVNKRLTPDLLKKIKSPSGYRLVGDGIDQDGNGAKVVRAVNTALILGMPLLVSGEPGSGKTALGYSIAWEFAKEPALLFVTKSTSKATDLFYEYDAVRHFQATSVANNKNMSVHADPKEYITYTALGLAILMAMPYSKRKKFLAPSLFIKENDENDHSILAKIRRRLLSIEQYQSVVIIDEIDKASRDFPNDLLHEIDNVRFRIPELGGMETPELEPCLKPIIIITTNTERQLPDPFLRRCAYVHIEYPIGATLDAILESRLDYLYKGDRKFMTEMADFYTSLRQKGRLDKEVSISEFLQFLQSLYERGVKPNKGMKAHRDILEGAISLLAKSRKDEKTIVEEFNYYLDRKGPARE